MNSVISAFKTKKNTGNSAAASDKTATSSNTLSVANVVSAKKKAAAISAQDNGYQYLRHIREIESATKMLSPVVVVDDFRPPCVDVVDHAPATVRLLDTTLPASDYNMNGGAKCATLNGGGVVRMCTTTTSTVANLENGNCNEANSTSNIPASKTALTNGQTFSPPTPGSPLLDGDDDESEHSNAACTSSSSEHSNSTVVHSPTSVTRAGTGTTVVAHTQQQQPSPAKSLRSNSSTSSSSSSTSATSSASSTSATSSIATAAICNSGLSSCSSSTSCDVTTLANNTASPHNSTLTLSSTTSNGTGCSGDAADVAVAPHSPTDQLINNSSATDEDYVPAFLKSAPVTLPIIMPNGNSSLASMPPHFQGYGMNGGCVGVGVGMCGGTPVNSASTTPKHVRYPKPRLSLSRFINHSMPSVHGRPNLSVAGGAATAIAAAGGAAGTNPPKRISTHQRNLSLDFR
ncbi:unnamed protein product [Ceratitis capitata]|uniref:(Mediterranean fruit fly) hypothetical protein n=4 Tax=Ceratitis capitata TaxID=7213 RepID=A0A811UX24_CERCA|nr:unnamed protein product [Ceratitis capitata]